MSQQSPDEPRGPELSHHAIDSIAGITARGSGAVVCPDGIADVLGSRKDECARICEPAARLAGEGIDPCRSLGKCAFTLRQPGDAMNALIEANINMPYPGGRDLTD